LSDETIGMMKTIFSEINKTILVIDDMKLNFQIIKKIFQPYPNIQIQYIQDPRETISFLRLNPIDIILLDFEMPHINGLDLCEKIKADKDLKHIPILFFTASSAQSSIEEAFQKGVDDYINKPICIPELLSRLQKVFENQRLKEELQNKYDEQVSFNRLVSHDLSNYIFILKSSSISLVKNKDSFSESEQKAIARIAKTSDRMDELLLNIRNIQALDDSKIKVEKFKSKIDEILNETISNFQEKLVSKDIKVKLATKYSESHPIVWAEKTSLLNSVFGNILSNAIKFSEKGKTIDITTEEKDENVFVTIKDNGIGMDEKLLRNVFSKTEKTSRPGTENESGTGFGMPLVKSFMQQYGGDIELTSIPKIADSNNHGTMVKLKFKKVS